MNYFRRIIRIAATDSPNVALALQQIAAGLEPTGEVIVPGVLTWQEYCNRRKHWSPSRQCVGLRGEFWEGPEDMLYPQEWLEESQRQADALRGRPRKARAIGIDPAEGGDDTVMAAVDEQGLVELHAKRTADTAVIVTDAVNLMKRLGVPAEMVMFDRGGGGKQHADRLRAMGHAVRTVAFGEAATQAKRRGMRTFAERRDEEEQRSAYVNRRAQLYHGLRDRLDPQNPANAVGGRVQVFAVGREHAELLRQLGPIPLMTDREGRFVMMPKDNPVDADDPRTLRKLLGRSPDHADAVCVAVYCMSSKTVTSSAGGF